MNNIILNTLGTTATLVLAVIFYASAFFLLWRSLTLRLQQITEINFAPHNALTTRYALSATAIGLLLQVAVTSEKLIQSEPTTTLSLSLFGVSNLVSCVMVAVIALSALRVRAENLLLLCLPLAAANLLALTLLPEGRTQPISLDSSQISHILLSISAYATLMTAALQSILIGVQERRLRTPQTGLLGLLPPMESMEKLFIFVLWLGLGLLTLSIATGMLFLQNMFDQRLVHHTVLTTLSWLVYAGFLAGHHFFGWRGVTGVRWNLAAFTLLLLGYLGSKFVIEYLL
ncbi:MAG: inner membrane protein YpjD [Proteobacteria bacterium]|nr:inner membrane protein YpjD [Pseudomonadota bacterium]